MLDRETMYMAILYNSWSAHIKRDMLTIWSNQDKMIVSLQLSTDL